MKKIVTLSVLSLGVLFLAGCGQQPVSQTQSIAPAPVAQAPAKTVPSTTQVPKVNPKEIVENYAKYTLGIPANYDLAKQYLTPELQSQFSNTPGFVPQSYGIQDVPNSIIVNNASVSENTATVRVIGQYPPSQLVWEFTLVVYNNEWKISNISKVSE